MLIGASGALNPEKDPRVNAVAVKMYEQFRNRKFDYVNVARNTGFSVEQMVIVKNYVFMDCHEFNNGYTLFTASYEMAQSWQRLSEKTPDRILAHDILMLQHELYEIQLLLANNGMSQQEAHTLAAKKYNYSAASRKYYRDLFNKPKEIDIF